MNRYILFLSLAAILAWLGAANAQDTTFVGVAQCQGCHSVPQGGAEKAVFPFWQETEHAVAFDSASAFVQSTASCLECHTTGWDTTLANGGADDFVTVETSGSITVVDQIEFDKKTNVQCESCHGPASDHVARIFSDGVTPPGDEAAAETCGACHQDEHHPYIEEWSMAKHAISNTNNSPFLQDLFRNDPNCSGCHTFQGFLQFIGTTSEDTTNIIPNIANPPGDNSKPIVCAACHDPHDPLNEHQLRLPAVELCVKCHNPEDAEPPENPHHSTSSMFAGTGAVEFAGFTWDNQSIHQVLDPAASEKCVTCHLFMTGFGEDPNDPRAKTGHTFEPRIEGCEQAGCHVNGLMDTGGEEFNHRGRQTFTVSLMDSLAAIIADIETNVLPTASAEDSLKYEDALFNLRFVQNEGSKGVHNADYAESILLNTITYIDTAIVTSVEAIPDAGTPRTFALHQNYPNPFNPTTTIRFDVPNAGPVKLIIYNAIGQRVETLVDEKFTPGSYSVDFNATALSSGLYFYKIVADGFSVSKKMLLLK